MTIYLYKKTHNKTGLKYLGKTSRKDPHKYKGSGNYWIPHIKKHGYNVTTEVLRACSTNEELKHWGLYYSDLWNIVDERDENGKKTWANLKPEAGDGGDTSNTINYRLGIMSRNLKNNAKFQNAIQQRDMSNVKKMRKGRSPTTEYNLRWYNNGDRNLYVTEGTQPSEYIPGRLMAVGRTVSDDTKMKSAIANGKKCESPNGQTFHSTKAAGDAYGITDVAIRGLIKRGKSGWKYIIK